MDIAVIEAESKIRKMVADDNGRVAIFEYSIVKLLPGQTVQGSDLGKHVVTVSTFNEQTKEISLMFTSNPSKSIASALTEVVRYLEVIKPTMCPFTLRWAKKGLNKESELSHFYCNDAMEVLEKFFATRNRKEYVIYSLEMKGCE